MGKHHVPLVIYGEDGERHVVGEASVDLNPISQEMEIVGEFTDEEVHKRLFEGINTAYSIDSGE